jgi:hypothetical protein
MSPVMEEASYVSKVVSDAGGPKIRKQREREREREKHAQLLKHEK